MVPGVIKRSKTVNSFQNAYRRHGLKHGPRSDKKIENSEQFSKCIQKARREHGGKRLGWHRDGNQPVAGNYMGYWM